MVPWFTTLLHLGIVLLDLGSFDESALDLLVWTFNQYAIINAGLIVDVLLRL